MKNIIALSFVFLLAQTSSAAEMLAYVNHHEVISDKAAEGVPEGHCLVKGTVYNARTKKPIQGVLLAPLNKETTVLSDSLGSYSILINSQDTSFFAYMRSFDEYVIWNYAFKEKHEVVINFYLNENIKIHAMKKPVIYMHCDEDLSATVSLDFKGDLTFTYPEYKDGWNVEMIKNQIYVDGQAYPYLFWEGDLENLSFERHNQQLNGSVLSREECIPFLESKLEQMGFNSKETEDFITFWSPELLQNQYVFIQFMSQGGIEEIAQLNVSPQPTNISRVYMLFETYNEKPTHLNCTEQHFESFNREGFFVLEWGGSNIGQKEQKL